ncbi:cytosolic protein [Bacillus sp. V5-8f]|uniref:cytosolic protein n=1 Tax=Bacillus sp. V5-8f TaxID=2053044 RepID=UPI000C771E8F|nr:cytosolic protein [Bacillus sp. V5-8f]PLT33991.1 cytosolic protein [Bacillus sp. V5-8f]
MEGKEHYNDFGNVEKQRNYLIPEEFPEGPYGAPRGETQPVENKSGTWRKGQRQYSAFNYENKSLHENTPRIYVGAHPVHDDPASDEQPPYTQTDNQS